MLATIDSQTAVLAVIGNPISHSASPRMQNAAIRHAGLNAVYLPILVELAQLGMVLDGLKACHYVGLNVTVPFKEAVIPFLDDLDVSASRAGAVNTIVNRDDRWLGYNTDGSGFVYALQTELSFSVQSTSVTVLGAGGAARGVVMTLLEQHIRQLTIVNRNLERADALRAAALLHFPDAQISVMGLEDDALDTVLYESDLVVHTSTIGMAPYKDRCLLSRFDWVHADTLLCDIIYKPTETVLMAKVKQRGGRVFGGAGMLAGQGMLAFEHFFGQHVPYSIFREQLDS